MTAATATTKNMTDDPARHFIARQINSELGPVVS
jgi:hypothetical protein